MAEIVVTLVSRIQIQWNQSDGCEAFFDTSRQTRRQPEMLVLPDLISDPESHSDAENARTSG
jgi:hypothetical protein